MLFFLSLVAILVVFVHGACENCADNEKCVENTCKSACVAYGDNNNVPVYGCKDSETCQGHHVSGTTTLSFSCVSNCVTSALPNGCGSNSTCQQGSDPGTGWSCVSNDSDTVACTAVSGCESNEVCTETQENPNPHCVSGCVAFDEQQNPTYGCPENEVCEAVTSPNKRVGPSFTCVSRCRTSSHEQCASGSECAFDQSQNTWACTSGSNTNAAVKCPSGSDLECTGDQICVKTQSAENFHTWEYGCETPSDSVEPDALDCGATCSSSQFHECHKYEEQLKCIVKSEFRCGDAQTVCAAEPGTTDNKQCVKFASLNGYEYHCLSVTSEQPCSSECKAEYQQCDSNIRKCYLVGPEPTKCSPECSADDGLKCGLVAGSNSGPSSDGIAHYSYGCVDFCNNQCEENQDCVPETQSSPGKRGGVNYVCQDRATSADNNSGDSVGNSIGDSAGNSVGDSAGNSVGDSAGESHNGQTGTPVDDSSCQPACQDDQFCDVDIDGEFICVESNESDASKLTMLLSNFAILFAVIIFN